MLIRLLVCIADRPAKSKYVLRTINAKAISNQSRRNILSVYLYKASKLVLQCGCVYVNDIDTHGMDSPRQRSVSPHQLSEIVTRDVLL